MGMIDVVEARTGPMNLPLDISMRARAAKLPLPGHGDPATPALRGLPYGVGDSFVTDAPVCKEITAMLPAPQSSG